MQFEADCGYGKFVDCDGIIDVHVPFPFRSSRRFPFFSIPWLSLCPLLFQRARSVVVCPLQAVMRSILAFPHAFEREALHSIA